VGLRQTLNENPVITSAVVGTLTLVALFFVGRSACGGGPESLDPSDQKAFYTVDEGKTKFVDSANKIPPFDKDGKQAYRAIVFKCADGKEFVNHLERYPEDQRAAIEKAGGPSGSMLGALAKEIRKPGDKAWVSMQKDPAKFAKVAAARCPDGSSNATLVEAK
jgi:hypothetical protein